MKLERIILENFRSYKDKTEIYMSDLTAFIGKNDSGKSTILEALEIFFNNKLVKIESNDLNVNANNQIITIGLVFSEFPKNLIVDSSAVTNLKDEFLLNENGELEIIKKYDCSKKNVKEEIYINAYYPNNEKFANLHNLKISQLSSRAKELGVSDLIEDNRSNVSIRKAIYSLVTIKDLELTELSLKGEVKSIWEKLMDYLPLYSLFQSDRPSLDGDAEVQDPMKLAIKEALEAEQSKIDEIKASVQTKALEVANNTVEKIQEMDENLAKQLSPHFLEEPKLDKIFKLSLEGDEAIPINKRGSGVRRLILLNFFRAEAERKTLNSDNQSIIYAIEEPETAQHPNNQALLAEALKELSANNRTQVVLTTHVPSFAQLLPIVSLNYVTKENSINTIKKAEDNPLVIEEIAGALGVLPPPIDKNVKVAILVEGVHDVTALKHFSKILHSENEKIVDLNESKNIIMLPTGGTTLKNWIDDHYLKSLDIPEVHIYDRDEKENPKYKKYCDKINNREDKSVAFLTKKRELENYIHHGAIEQVLDVKVEVTDDCDLPKVISNYEEIKYNPKTVKAKLNNEVIPAMTINQLNEVDTYGEVKEWLTEISNFCN